MRLHEWIAEHGLNQSQAAEFFRVTRPTFSRWMHGAIPHVGRLRRIYRLTRGAVEPRDFYDFGRRPRHRRAPRKPFDPFQPITEAADIEAILVTEADIRAAIPRTPEVP